MPRVSLDPETYGGTDTDQRTALRPVDDPRLYTEEGHWRPPSADSRGHGQHLSLRIPESVGGEIAQIIESRRFPYRYSADLVRHAILEHLAWLERLNGRPSTLPAERAMMVVVDAEERDRARMGIFDKLESQVRAAEAEGADEHAAGLVSAVWRNIGEMQEGYWRERYLGEMASRFRRFIEEEP